MPQGAHCLTPSNSEGWAPSQCSGKEGVPTGQPSPQATAPKLLIGTGLSYQTATDWMALGNRTSSPEVQNQGVGRAGSFLGSVMGNVLLTFSQLLVVASSLWGPLRLCHSLSAAIVTRGGLCVSNPPSVRTPVVLDEGSPYSSVASSSLITSAVTLLPNEATS